MKKALLTGINFYDTSSELAGCVNDIMNVETELQKYGFETENIILSVWGKNIGDTSYWQDYNAAAFSGAFGDIGFLARGRTYGVDVEYRF